jgi:hypothetical protein
MGASDADLCQAEASLSEQATDNSQEL